MLALYAKVYCEKAAIPILYMDLIITFLGFFNMFPRFGPTYRRIVRSIYNFFYILYNKTVDVSQILHQREVKGYFLNKSLEKCNEFILEEVDS
jgi:hypothetical protein